MATYFIVFFYKKNVKRTKLITRAVFIFLRVCCAYKCVWLNRHCLKTGFRARVRATAAAYAYVVGTQVLSALVRQVLLSIIHSCRPYKETEHLKAKDQNLLLD